MTVFNTYNQQLIRGWAAFLAELQGLEFISEVLRIITKIESNFVDKLKQKNNWKQAGYPKKDLDSLSTPLHMANISWQVTKAH